MAAAYSHTERFVDIGLERLSMIYTHDLAIEERQSEDICTLLRPPLPPRPKRSLPYTILSKPVPLKHASKQQSPSEETNSSSNPKKKNELKPKLHHLYTTGAEQIYESIKISPQLPLLEIITKFASDIPFRLSVCESMYGENSLLAGEFLNVHFLKETTVVHAVCTHSERKLIIPINSSIQCSVMYNPVEIAEIGFSFPTTSHLFQSRPLPQVVAVEEKFDGKKKASSFVKGEVLVLKEFNGRKQLKCISIPSNKLKVLHESMKLSVTTDLSKIRLYLSEVVQHLNFPVKVKLFSTERKLQQLLKLPHILTMLCSKKSLIASSYHNHETTKGIADSCVEILANVPIKFEVFELEEDERQQLLVNSKTFLDQFHPSCVKEVIADTSVLTSSLQTLVFQSVQDGEAWKNGVTITLPVVQRPTFVAQTISSRYPISSEQYNCSFPVTDKHVSVLPTPLQRKYSCQQIDHSLREYSTTDSTHTDCTKAATISGSIKEELLHLQDSNSELIEYIENLRLTVDGDLNFMNSRKDCRKGSRKVKNYMNKTVTDDDVPCQELLLTNLSIDQVLQLLDKLGLSKYKHKFIEESITGSLLSEFDEEILETELGINSRIHRIKLMRIIDGRQSIDELFESDQ